MKQAVHDSIKFLHCQLDKMLSGLVFYCLTFILLTPKGQTLGPAPPCMYCNHWCIVFGQRNLIIKSFLLELFMWHVGLNFLILMDLS